MMPRVEIVNGKKKCWGCDAWLELAEFHRSARGAGGRQPRCKRCRREQQGIYRHLALRDRENEDAPSPLAARRSCLQCGRMFESAGPGNRRCERCRNANVGSPAPGRIKE
jgi:hypothetical protein